MTILFVMLRLGEHLLDVRSLFLALTHQTLARPLIWRTRHRLLLTLPLPLCHTIILRKNTTLKLSSLMPKFLSTFNPNSSTLTPGCLPPPSAR